MSEHWSIWLLVGIAAILMIYGISAQNRDVSLIGFGVLIGAVIANIKITKFKKI